MDYRTDINDYTDEELLTDEEQAALEAASATLGDLTEDDVAGEMSERGRAWLDWKDRRKTSS